MKKILISGTMSGSGKTTVSSILMSAFENVAPFKVGPDYIDPGYHELFTGNKSHNLDAFMFDGSTLKHVFETGADGKNIAIVEGVMGLYDGVGHEKDNFSTAHLSRILDIPIILVVNAKGISTSIAAEILGFKLFDENVKIKHFQKARAHTPTHSISVATNCFLSDIYPEGIGFINSYHHQTINQLAPGFSTIAKSTDGVIEAIENISNKTFIIGVQWHPEMMAINDELAQKLFKKFVNEVSLRKKD